MSKDNIQEHNAEIVDQFTRQAIPFTRLPGHLDSIQMLIEFCNVGENDTVLDVACGPGIVTCEFAKKASRATGIDITQQMIEEAKKRQQQAGLSNVSWDIGTALPLPYESNSFSIVITRYSFHHFLEPAQVLREMIRVCKRGGVVLIADAALPENKIDAYNHMEKLRDPSHTRALSLDQWEELMNDSGLKNLKRGSYKVEMEMKAQLKASFPKPGDATKVKAIISRDIGINALGMNVRKDEGKIYFSYPISIYTGKK